MIIHLKNEFLNIAVDSVGAQLISMRDNNDTEYIWQRDAKYWDKCSPVLFPQIGNARNDKTIIHGKEYSLLKHGFCRDMDFEVKILSYKEAVFSISNTKETLKVYPFLFNLSLSYRLDNERLYIEYRVKNNDEKILYYLIGAHPGFRCPIYEGDRFEDYIIKFEKYENAYSTVYDLEKKEFDINKKIHILDNTDTIELRHALFENDAIYLDDLSSRRVGIINKNTKKGIELDYNSFDTVAFWTAMPDAPFICIEPWNGAAIRSDEDDNFENRFKVQELGSNEEKKYRIIINTTG